MLTLAIMDESALAIDQASGKKLLLTACRIDPDSEDANYL